MIVPFLYQDLPSPEEMEKWDSLAKSKFDQPPVMLMENASRSALYTLEKYFNLKHKKKILVFAGRGNNGGDGIALARHLDNIGHDVLVYSIKKLENLKTPCFEHYEMARLVGVNFTNAESFNHDQGSINLPKIPEHWEDTDIVIDALCGTGFHGPLRPSEINLIENINALRKHFFILSLDIPSGLNGLNGKAQPTAIIANATATFEAGKPGLFFPEAKKYTGEIHVCPIGLPKQVREETPASWLLISPKAGSWAKPALGLHKGNAGKILIVGGSDGMAGAPVLSAHGALRGGAGLVKILCPDEIASLIISSPEIMVKGLGEGKIWGPKMGEEISEEINSFSPSAIVLGPGMGRNYGAFKMVEKILNHPTRPPVILDADALYFFRREENEHEVLISSLREEDIITPHPMELSRILPDEFFMGDSANKVSYIQNNRVLAAEFVKNLSPSVCIIKGAGTLISQRNHPIALCPYDVPSLAVAGSGDVLAGLVASLVGSNTNKNPLSSFDAASLGVYLHARAGQIKAETQLRGNLAHETAAAIPLAWEELTTCLEGTY